jgi:hypothetical protein
VVDLTRRWFVFGSAAALALASVPAIVAPDTVQKVLVPGLYKTRKIRDIFASFDLGPEEQQINAFAEMAISRNGTDIFRIGLNTRGSFRWVAAPLHEIVVPARGSVNLSVKSPRGVGLVSMVCADDVDDGPPILVSEHYRFPRGGGRPTVDTLFMEVDNSIDARRRREAASAVARSWEPEDDEPCYDGRPSTFWRERMEEIAGYYNEVGPDKIASWTDDELRSYVADKFTSSD